jgi:hypothetical protein
MFRSRSSSHILRYMASTWLSRMYSWKLIAILPSLASIQALWTMVMKILPTFTFRSLSGILFHKWKESIVLIPVVGLLTWGNGISRAIPPIISRSRNGSTHTSSRFGRKFPLNCLRLQLFPLRNVYPETVFPTQLPPGLLLPLPSPITFSPSQLATSRPKLSPWSVTPGDRLPLSNRCSTNSIKPTTLPF